MLEMSFGRSLCTICGFKFSFCSFLSPALNQLHYFVAFGFYGIFISTAFVPLLLSTLFPTYKPPWHWSHKFCVGKMTIKGPWAFSFGVLSSQILWALKVMDFLQNNYCADARWRVRDLLYPQYFCLEENMWRKEKSCPQNFQQWTYEEERKTFACLLPNSLKTNECYLSYMYRRNSRVIEVIRKFSF